ncbi:MAG: glycoside hydrolase family 30 beta sandwich domain-containing protein [Rikenellaceae bacterium]
MKKLKYTALLSLMFFAAANCSNASEDVNSSQEDVTPNTEESSIDVAIYTTTTTKSYLFKESSADYTTVSMSPYRIDIDEATTYQTIDGFGPAVTGASCYNLMMMTESDREKILRQCFDPEEGVGFSFIRVHIGGSDFSRDEYTYCDTEGIENFATPYLESSEIFPIIEQILEINPDIKILGSPWSCPRWMKVDADDLTQPYYSWTSGRLNPDYYEDYAEYFALWIKTWENQGFPIYAITMQNEPLNKGNSMSLYMPWEDQAAFTKVLGPKLQDAGYGDVKILSYDHNYNYDNIDGQEDYPLNIFADSDAAQWLDGSAWHNYGGSVTELDQIISQAPSKTIYFTEASIGTWNYTFEGCLMTDFEDIFLGTLSREGKGVLLWNMMLDDNGAPNRPGGCTTCYGAIEIDSSSYSYESLNYLTHYYNMAHCSKVIDAGAQRIGASGYTTSGLSYLAFKNPDGSYAFVALNNSDAAVTVAIYQSADQSFKYEIPALAIASMRWNIQ